MRRAKNYLRKDTALIKRLWFDINYKVEDIVRYLHCSPNTLYKQVKKLGLPRRYFSRRRYKLVRNIELAIPLVKADVPTAIIAERLGISYNTAWYAVQRAKQIIAQSQRQPPEPDGSQDVAFRYPGPKA